MPPVNRILQKFLSATHFYPFPYQVSYPIASQTKNTFFRISTKLIESFLSTQIFSLFIWIKDSLKNLLYRSSSNCTLIVVIDEVQLEYPCSLINYCPKRNNFDEFQLCWNFLYSFIEFLLKLEKRIPSL